MAVLTTYSNRADLLMSGRAAVGTDNPSVESPEIIYSKQLDFGTAADQCNQECWTTVTVAINSAATTIDLTATLTNHAGQVVNLSKVRRLILRNKNTSLTVFFGGGASNAWTGPLGGTTPTYAIPPGVTVVFDNPTLTGWAVNSAVKNFKLLNTDATSTVDVEIYVAGVGS